MQGGWEGGSAGEKGTPCTVVYRRGLPAGYAAVCLSTVS
jgi:hypothetical protein